MNDRERILTHIIDRLASTQLLANHRHGYDSEEYRDGDTYRVHFAYSKDAQVGDLVLAQTGGISEFKIGFVHHVVSESNLIIREIGSDKLCNYANERFVPIYGLTEIDLLEGEKHEFYIKVQKAFRKLDNFWHRFGGIHFDGNTVEIRVRERYGGLKAPTDPYTITIKWSKSMTIKRIMALMVEGGFGITEFVARKDGGK
jgi:PAS domain-containing protein